MCPGRANMFTKNIKKNEPEMCLERANMFTKNMNKLTKHVSGNGQHVHQTHLKTQTLTKNVSGKGQHVHQKH